MKRPFGIVFVFACEAFLSLAAGVLGLLYLCYGFYGVLHGDWARAASSIAAAVVLLGIAVSCYFTSVGLLNRLRWAWHSSIGMGLFAASFAIYCIYAAQKSEQPAWGEGFGLFLLIPVLFGGLILLLPSTRNFFQGNETGSS